VKVFLDFLFLFTSRPSGEKKLFKKVAAIRPPVVLRCVAGQKETANTNNKRRNMIRHTLKVMAWIAIAGLVASSVGCRRERDSMVSPTTEGFPRHALTNQIVQLHESFKFEVPATSIEILSHPHQQWFFNGFPIDKDSAKMLGVTGFDTKTLSGEHAELINCGFYSYQNENEPELDKIPLSREFSETAQLLIISNHVHVEEALFIGGPPAGCVVYGIPIGGPGGIVNKCPGKYLGYVEYQNANDPSHGWYLTDTNKNGMAYDANPQAKTEVYYIGVPSTNWGCGTNIPASKYPYHFRIYFTKAPIPSGAYGLTLAGFKIP
jgi:hypothetical protein